MRDTESECIGTSSRRGSSQKDNARRREERRREVKGTWSRFFHPGIGYVERNFVVMLLGQAESGTLLATPIQYHLTHAKRQIDPSEAIPNILCPQIPRRRTTVLETCSLLQHYQSCPSRVQRVGVPILCTRTRKRRGAESGSRANFRPADKTVVVDSTRGFAGVASEWWCHNWVGRARRGFCAVGVAVLGWWIFAE